MSVLQPTPTSCSTSYAHENRKVWSYFVRIYKKNNIFFSCNNFNITKILEFLKHSRPRRSSLEIRRETRARRLYKNAHRSPARLTRLDARARRACAGLRAARPPRSGCAPRGRFVEGSRKARASVEGSWEVSWKVRGRFGADTHLERAARLAERTHRLEELVPLLHLGRVQATWRIGTARFERACERVTASIMRACIE